MKKVGVITFHSAENSGAVLQCIALQTALKNVGVDPYVIDYQPQYLKDQYRVFLNPFAEASKNHTKGIKYLLAVMAYIKQDMLFYRKLTRKRKFAIFRQQNMKLSERYTSIDELKLNPPQSDVYIAGSDQIWNSMLTGGVLDPAFFLQFGSDNVKRYTYAISIGKQVDAEAENIAKMSSHIDIVSLREPSVFADIRSQYEQGKLVQSVDPTLLIDINDWKKYVSENPFKRQYVLIYALEKNQKFRSAIISIKKRYPEISIVDISQCNLNLREVNIRKMSFSPDEFLNMIWHSDYVLTNSFHCTLFSIIFRKEFEVIAHTRSNARIHDLLVALGLDRRMYDGSNIQQDEINWNEVDHNISDYRKESLNYLKKIVELG